MKRNAKLGASVSNESLADYSFALHYGDDEELGSVRQVLSRYREAF